jgi:hypothetical protein
MKFHIIAVLSLALALTQAYGATIFGLCNTGVNNDGTFSPGNSIDTHYALISVPAGATNIAYVPSVIPTSYPFPGGWIVITNAQWLAPATNATSNEPPGIYDYRLTFKLVDSFGNPLDPATATISGMWAADDDGGILFNGAPLAGGGAVGFSGLSSFTINSGFLAGTNTLDFVVTNANSAIPNPSGVLIAGLSGTASELQNETSLSISLYAGIQISGQVGSTDQLQYATTLRGTNWTTLTNIVLTTSPLLYIDLQPINNQNHRFYRALQMN